MRAVCLSTSSIRRANKTLLFFPLFCTFYSHSKVDTTSQLYTCRAGSNLAKKTKKTKKKFQKKTLLPVLGSHVEFFLKKKRTKKV
jgi:hypothetical protein